MYPKGDNSWIQETRRHNLLNLGQFRKPKGTSRHRRVYELKHSRQISFKCILQPPGKKFHTEWVTEADIWDVGEWNNKFQFRTRSCRKKKKSYDINPQRSPREATSKGRDTLFSQNYIYLFKITLHKTKSSIDTIPGFCSGEWGLTNQHLCLIVSVLHLLDGEGPLWDGGWSCLTIHQQSPLPWHHFLEPGDCYS